MPPKAVDLSKLDPRECLELERLLEEHRFRWNLHARPEQKIPQDDWWNNWLILTGRGWGKALALNTPIPTPRGWTTMGELKEGDVVLDERGMPCNVTYATEVQHGRVCYEVVFSDGTSVVADADHLWLTMDKCARKAFGRARNPRCVAQTRTTEQIRSSLRTPNGREVNHSVDVAAPLQLPELSLPIPPYTLGVWLGDGSSSCAALTVGEEYRDEQIALLASDGTLANGKPNFSRDRRTLTIGIGCASPVRSNGAFSGNGSLHSRLRAMGLLRNKHIPNVYLRASESQRLALLQGLMDTDGSVQEGGHAEFLVVNERLASGVYELACTLGLKPTFSEERASLYGRDCGKRFRVSFTPHRPVFRLRKKLERQHNGKSQASRNFRRYIVDVLSTESVPVRCITVDSPSHLYLCSRAFIPTHNTRTGAETVREWTKLYPRMHLVAPTAADARDTMVEGESGILACSPSWDYPKYEPSKRRLTWPNGCIAHLFSADEPERLRGPQCYGYWADELAAWRYLDDTWAMLQFGVRLGKHPRGVITTTPRPVKVVKDLMHDPSTFVTRGHTYENRANLAGVFLKAIEAKYGGTRLGRQELEGILLDDNPLALWRRAWIEDCRVRALPEEFTRIVVAVDPPVAEDGDGAECGIVVEGKAWNGEFYTLEDASMQGTPSEWANRVKQVFDAWKADLVVAEANQGGAMVKATIQAARVTLPVKLVYASRGKRTRAEPISALYEQKRVHHYGCFPKLEDQMCEWTPGDKSPDRMDAHVWGLTELSGSGEAFVGGNLDVRPA